jgi:hypothetical protein
MTTLLFVYPPRPPPVQPLVVMTSQPTLSSAVVQALVGMIWPLKYCADYRPFFTIHDSEFKEYTTRTQAPLVYHPSLSVLFSF